MQPSILSSTAFVLILASGIGHRWLMGQWGGAEKSLHRAVARLDAIPARIGDWSGEDMVLDRRQIERSGIAGYLSRKYVNRSTGSVVHLLIVCGPPGPVSVHSPEVCMRGAGYNLMEEPAACRLDTGSGRPSGRFRSGDFVRHTQPTSEMMRVLWGWNSGDGWKIPENPRLEYAGRSSLYKVYVSRSLDRQNVPIESDPCVQFLREFLPHSRRAFRDGDRLSSNS